MLHGAKSNCSHPKLNWCFLTEKKGSSPSLLSSEVSFTYPIFFSITWKQGYCIRAFSDHRAGSEILQELNSLLQELDIAYSYVWEHTIDGGLDQRIKSLKWIGETQGKTRQIKSQPSWASVIILNPFSWKGDSCDFSHTTPCWLSLNVLWQKRHDCTIINTRHTHILTVQIWYISGIKLQLRLCKISQRIWQNI